jgi:hypothetical protein
MSLSTESSFNTTLVSSSFEQKDEDFTYEVAFRRWLVREIEEQRLTPAQAIERFNFHPNNGYTLIHKWRLKYAGEMVLSLPEMTFQEKQDLALLQAKTKELEKQLEQAKMYNIALNTLIDVAEEKLKISIRKKPGAKR